MLADHVLFLDGEALVVDKPAGLPVDAPRNGALSVQSHLQSLRFGFERVPTPVHRLDRDTSGCLLLARNPGALKRFGQAFEAGGVKKVYWAVLDGVPDGEGGLVDMALGKTSTREAGWRMVPDVSGKAARTAWRVLDTRDGRALVEMRPETGRTHQLRVHAAGGLGAAIVGDRVYGRAGEPPSTGSGQGMLLHARALRIERAGKRPVEAEAPLPRHWLDAGWSEPPLP